MNYLRDALSEVKPYYQPVSGRKGSIDLKRYTRLVSSLSLVNWTSLKWRTKTNHTRCAYCLVGDDPYNTHP